MKPSADGRTVTINNLCDSCQILTICKSNKLNKFNLRCYFLIVIIIYWTLEFSTCIVHWPIYLRYYSFTEIALLDSILCAVNSRCDDNVHSHLREVTLLDKRPPFWVLSRTLCGWSGRRSTRCTYFRLYAWRETMTGGGLQLVTRGRRLWFPFLCQISALWPFAARPRIKNLLANSRNLLSIPIMSQKRLMYIVKKFHNHSLV